MGQGSTLLMLDCDGTLMDSIGAWHEAERQVAESAGITLTKEERDELNTLTLEEAGDWFFRSFGVGGSGEAVTRAIDGYMVNYYRTSAVASPGALEFVRTLHGAGVKMCVLSSSPQRYLQAGLARGGFLPYLQAVVSVEDLETTKRDVETYRHVCEQLGARVSESWLFDDSWYALDTARRAGCKTVGVYSTDLCATHEELSRYGDLVVDSFAELDPTHFIAR